MWAEPCNFKGPLAWTHRISRRAMMELVHVAVVVLSLLSAGQSAPLINCESLTHRLEIQGREQLLGRWTYIGDSTDMPGTKALSKMFIDTTTVNISAGDKNDTINTTQTQKMMGRCLSMSYQQTVQNNTISMEQPYPGSAVLLNTSCPDCLVIYSTSIIGQSTYRGLELLSRRPKVSVTELEEFTKQIKCLKLPRPHILDPEKGFCPEDPVSQGQTFDLNKDMNNFGPDQMSELDKLLQSRSGLKKIMDMVTTALEEIDPN